MIESVRGVLEVSLRRWRGGGEVENITLRQKSATEV